MFFSWFYPPVASASHCHSLRHQVARNFGRRIIIISSTRRSQNIEKWVQLSNFLPGSIIAGSSVYGRIYGTSLLWDFYCGISTFHPSSMGSRELLLWYFYYSINGVSMRSSLHHPCCCLSYCEKQTDALYTL